MSRYSKDGASRKIDVRIDKWDVWSLDTTLAYIIMPALVKLKEQKHGSPFISDEDVPEELRSTSVPESIIHSTDDNWHKRWDWVLDEMIWAFTQIRDKTEDQFCSGNHDADFIEAPLEMPAGMTDEERKAMLEVADEEGGVHYTSKLVRGPLDTFKIDFEGLQAYHARIDNGTRLFGKYFRSLWD